MSEVGSSESLAPGEGGAGASEQLSEEAKQRFAAAAAATKALQREEKKSKKRDSRVAHTIIQFLKDERYTHLFVLISRLVARDCPSVFILAVLSLINEEATNVVEEYVAEHGNSASTNVAGSQMPAPNAENADVLSHAAIVKWITRMQMVLSLETVPILTKLLVDEQNIDGTVLQLSTFVLQEFFQSATGGKRTVPFEKLHLLSANILQTVFEPFMDKIDAAMLPKQGSESAGNDDQ